MTVEQRIEHLERTVKIQAAMLAKARELFAGHQAAIEALASLAGVKIEKRPAPDGPVVSVN
ncbi:MAG TPA: hypothetical protein VFA33_08680 [Bryobacteraceae bacterium]|nr:hypothetical protein [Bryobacteraceae bacterium]